MKTLETGENIKLGEFGRQLSLSTNSNQNKLYLMADTKIIAEVFSDLAIDLNAFLGDNVKNLELVCKVDRLAPCNVAILKNNDLICKHTENLNSIGAYVVGKLYFYGDQEWRYRALNQKATDQQIYTLNHLSNNTPKTQSNAYSSVLSQSNTNVQPRQNIAVGSELSVLGSVYSGNKELSKMQNAMLPSDLRNLYIGFGWKSLNTKAGIFTKLVANQSLEIDLDLALLTFTCNGFNQVVNGFNTRSTDNAIYHYGDKSESNGDSEMVSISFPALDPSITHIAIVVSSAKGHKFNLLEKSTLNLKNQEGMLPLVSYDLQNGEEKSSCLVGLLIKRASGWEFQTIEDYSKETNARDLKDLSLNWIKFIK